MRKMQTLGKQSMVPEEPVYIQGWGSVVGKKEGEGPMGACFDEIEEDPVLGAENWEGAESRLQLLAARKAAERAGISTEEIRMIFAGDLLAQSIASSFGIGRLDRPVYGLFGACSTMGEALSLAALAVAAGAGEHVLALTSSHFATAEKVYARHRLLHDFLVSIGVSEQTAAVDCCKIEHFISEETVEKLSRFMEKANQ